MGLIAWRIRTLNSWLKAQGARRGDYIIDRATERCRYAIVRELPAAGYTTGQVLTALADGHLEPVSGLDEPTQTSHLRVVQGGLARRPPKP